MADDGHYSVREIVSLHLYHCLDCLYDDIMRGALECGCDDGATDALKEELTEEDLKRFDDSRTLADLWADHVDWAIKEYAK